MSPINVNTVKSVADHAILLGRFVEALAFIYGRAGTGLRVNLTPAQVKIENRIIRGKAYFDLQSQTWVAIEGFSGCWEEDRLLETGPQVEGGDGKFSSKSVVATLKAGEVEDPDKPRFSASKPMSFDDLVFKETVNKKKNEDNELAHAVKGDFSNENIEMIREHGGCEYLYKSYMVDVSEKRRKESGYMNEIGLRARYLHWLKGGREEWVPLLQEGGGSGSQGDLYAFGKVEVDMKTADRKFEVVEGGKKKKKKKKKGAVTPTPPLKPKPKLSLDTNVSDGSGEGKQEEKSAPMQSPLVARIKE